MLALASAVLAFTAPRARGAYRADVSSVRMSGTQASLVLAPSKSGSTDDLAIGGVCVRRFITDQGESWKCWYTGRGSALDDEVVPLASTGAIHLATSTDGINWKREGVVLPPNEEDWWWFDTSHVGVGDVQIMSSEAGRTGGVAMYWLYYFGGDVSRVDDGPKGSRLSIGLAMSSDGRNWGRVEGDEPNGAVLLPGDDGDLDTLLVGWPQVLQPKEGTYVMLYHSITKDGTYHVLAATSTDGVKFSKAGEVLGPGSEGAFDERGVGARHVFEPTVEDGAPDRYLMVYEGVSAAGEHSIGLASSPDGRRWSRVADKPILTPNQHAGAWDAGAVGRPFVVRLEDGRYRMYYYGQSGKGSGLKQDVAGIGVAECDAGDFLNWHRVPGAADPTAS